MFRRFTVALLAVTWIVSAGMQKMEPPKQVKRVEPVYPDTARQARIQGVVTVQATIGTDGKVKDAKVVGSVPQLDEAALTAVRQWEYVPTMLNGVATPVVMTVKVNFALSDVPAAAAAPAAQAAAIPDLLLVVQRRAEQVQASRDMPSAAARALLSEALTATDTIIASPDKTPQQYRLATLAKSLVLELQAERLAQTREQRLELLTEAERWNFERFKNGAPQAVLRLTVPETNELEWRAIRRWNAKLAADGKTAEAIEGYNRYLVERPGFYGAHAEIAELSLQTAREEKDEKVRTANYERAAAALQQVVDLAPTQEEREGAFVKLVEVYSPGQLKRPAQQEAVARAMVKRQPAALVGHVTLASVLLQNGKTADADAALRAARASLKPGAAARADLASALLSAIHQSNVLSETMGRRLFTEADALLTEAEKLNANDVRVLEGRMYWLGISATRFEKDPARAAAQRAQAKQLETRAIAIRAKGGL